MIMAVSAEIGRQLIERMYAQILNQNGFHSLIVDFYTWLESISKVPADLKSFHQTPSSLSCAWA